MSCTLGTLVVEDPNAGPAVRAPRETGDAHASVVERDRLSGANGHGPRRCEAFSQIRHCVAHAGNVLQQRLGTTRSAWPCLCLCAVHDSVCAPYMWSPSD